MDGAEGEHPLISLLDSQVPKVKRVLDAAGVRYEVNDVVIEYEYGPAMALIILRGRPDGRAIQKLLDAAD